MHGTVVVRESVLKQNPWVARSLLDAYTTSGRYPYATAAVAGVNYIRNAVKVAIDAYDGTTTFYLADAQDPIANTYARIFPTLFRPLSEMPADLVPHLRVPEELFNVQTRIFATYHVTDPSQFYNREDLWTVPVDAGSEQTLPSEAYYVVMRLPGESSAEFLLLQPMIAASRPKGGQPNRRRSSASIAMKRSRASRSFDRATRACITGCSGL